MSEKPKKKSRRQRQADIQNETCLAQVKNKTHEWIRLSRVTYWKNRSDFLDLRSFFRGYDEDGDREVLHPTKRGIQVKEDVFLDLLAGLDTVPPWLVHPRLRGTCLKALRSGDYERVQFEALRSVEVAVRRVGGFPNNLVGVQLMRRAFEPNKGPLADLTADPAEQEAAAHLFAGAIGALKNPTSHREVSPSREKAAQTLVFASYLLGVVDDRAAGGSGTP